MATELLFERAPLTSPPVDLVFGEAGDAPEVEIVVAGAFAAFGGAIRITTVSDASIAGAFPAFAGGVQMQYVSGAQRPVVGEAAAAWQIAVRQPAGVAQAREAFSAMRAGVQAVWEHGKAVAVDVEALPVRTLLPARVGTRAVHQDAQRVGTGTIRFAHDDGLRDRRLSRTSTFQAARRVGTAVLATGWQERLRDRRPTLRQAWQPAAALAIVRATSMQKGQALAKTWRAWHQDAIVPPPGLSPRPGVVEPPFDPCYLPDPHLVFAAAWPAGTGLMFICERHAGPPATVVVPIKRVYVVINEVSLRRVEGNVPLPAFALSLSLDADSWTWGFNASLPASVLAALEPDANGTPVELEAVVNGQPYRLLAERLARERQFGQAGIRVQGRGKAALLDAPYAAQRSFGNQQPRTAQQLAADVLTLNGVGIGWEIDWGLTDWLVPAGAFSHQGSFVSALGQIAAAAGGYLQPHATDPLLRVLPRYPVPSWQWSTAVPDIELPAAVTTRESIEWLEKPRYNRVFVSGTSQGLLGQITRQGTAGDLLAPMVTDALATHVDALRQRGIAVLSDTGRQANVTLKLPVLPETGVIVPGRFVRYVDGTTTRLGIVRSTGVEVGRPEVWQTIGVETRA